jgi:uncharacterized protein
MQRTLPKPGFWLAVLLSLMVVAGQIVMAMPLAFVDMVMESGFHVPPPHLASNPLMLGFVNIVAIGGTISLGLALNRLSFRQAFPFVRFSAWQCLGVAVTILGGAVLLSEADNLFRAVAPPPRFLLDAFKSLFADEGGLLGRVFLLVVVAPVTEELLFRGIVLRGLLSWHRPATAVSVTALLFALVHLNPWQFISAFFLGLVFGWIYLRTGSIALCILAHAVNNGLNVLLSSLPLEIPGFTGTPDFTKAVFQPWWLDLGGVLILLAGITMFRRATLADSSPAQPAAVSTPVENVARAPDDAVPRA